MITDAPSCRSKPIPADAKELADFISLSADEPIRRPDTYEVREVVSGHIKYLMI